MKWVRQEGFPMWVLEGHLRYALVVKSNDGRSGRWFWGWAVRSNRRPGPGRWRVLAEGHSPTMWQAKACAEAVLEAIDPEPSERTPGLREQMRRFLKGTP